MRIDSPNIKGDITAENISNATGDILTVDSNNILRKRTPAESLLDIGAVPYTGANQNVNLGEFGLSSGHIKLDTTPTNIPTDQGTIFWDEDDKTVATVLNGYILKHGEDQFYPVTNQTGAPIPKGTAVGFAGTLGMSGRLLAAPFLADGSMSSTFFMGVTAETIANGGEGKVLNFGRIRSIDTNSFNEGDVLYVSTTVPGGFQTTVPQAPNNIIQVAAVIAKSATVGTIFVRPTLGSSINKDEGVKITSGQTGDILQLQSNGLFENITKAQYLGGASSQFVKGDGSLDSTAYQTLLTNPITGTGTAGQVAFWNGTNTQTGDNGLFWDNTNKRLGVGTSTPTQPFHINANAIISSNSLFYFGNVNHYIANISGIFQIFSNSNTIRIRQDSSNPVRVALSGAGSFFSVSDGSTDDTFRVRKNGNVQIGTLTDAGFRLDVNGTTRFQGNSQITGNLLLNTTVDSGFRLDVNGTARVTSLYTADIYPVASSINLWVNSLNTASRFYTSSVNEDGRINFNAVAGGSNQVLIRAWHTGQFGLGTGSSNAGAALTVRGDSLLVGTSGSLYFMAGTFGPLNVPYRLGITTDATTTYFRSGVANNLTNIESHAFSFTAKSHTFYTGTTTGNQGNPNQHTPLHLSTLGNVGIGTTAPSERLHVDGRARITTIDNGTGDFTTISGTGVLTRRTAAETRTDIGAVGGTGVAGQVSFWNGTNSQTGDSGLFWDNVNKRLGVGTNAPTALVHIAAQGTLSTDVVFRVRNSGNTGDYIRVLGNNNVFVGFRAGNVNTGNNVTAYGTDALRNNTSGSSNTAFGADALTSNTTAVFNTAVGVQALSSNTTGADNTAMGAFSLQSNNGTNNSAFGYSALRLNTSGGNNSAFGENVFSNNTTGSNNIAFGVQAGRFIADGTTANTISNNSVFLGVNTKALADNQTNQIVIGHNAIGNGSNTATIGNASLTHLYFTGAKTISTTTGNLTLATAGGNGNIILSPNGTGRIGIGTTNPTSNLELRRESFNINNTVDTMLQISNTKYGSTDTSGESRLVFGWNDHYGASIAGFKDGTGNRTGFRFYTEVGFNTPVLKWTIASEGNLIANGAQTIQTSTGNLTLATGADNGNIILSPNGTGNVGIGNTANLTGGGRLQVTGDGRFTGDVIAFSSSDKRLKNNITTIENSLEKVLKLGGYSFDWNEKQDTYTGKDYGIIAQEVEALFPEMVQTRDNGMKAVKYDRLIPVMIEAIKELSNKVKVLEDR